MTFIDSNVILDIFGRDRKWFGWSSDRLVQAAAMGPVLINAVVIAELSRNFGSLADLWAKLKPLALASIAVEDDAAFLAGQRFVSYRRARVGDRAARVLPDFFIGAHAVTLRIPLLTRDQAIYRRYFPELTLITPETDHG